ncbi:MAG: phosphatidate cytidylyltransferase [Pseudomonadota bacterium]
MENLNALTKRVLTGVIGIPVVVLYALLTPPILFGLLITLVVALALWEYYNMVLTEEADKTLGKLTTVFSTFIYLIYILLLPHDAEIISLSLFLICLFIYFIVVMKVEKDNITKFYSLVFGFVYVALLFGSISHIRYLENGLQFIFLLLIIVWLTDTGAHFVGCYLVGKIKLHPMVSPNKTWEGAIGGFIAAIASAIAFKVVFFSALSLKHAIILATICSVFGQFGDLSESFIKRVYGVKDSGNILPGHGGFLDRIDSLVFAAPCMYVYINIFILG